MIINFANVNKLVGFDDFLSDALNLVTECGESPLLVLHENKPAFYVVPVKSWDLMGVRAKTQGGIEVGQPVLAQAPTPVLDKSQLISFDGEEATGEIFRSALCFWEEGSGPNSIASEAGPWAIAEYLQSPLDSRFIQSFKSVAASPLFERTMIWGKPLRFEDLGRLFLQRLVDQGFDPA